MTDKTEKSVAPDAKVKAIAAEGTSETQPENRLHPILSNEEVLKARAAARKRLELERTKAAMKAVEEEETERLRMEEGITAGPSYMDEMVTVTIDLAEFAPNLIINGHPYWHGHTYTVSRHIANSLREMMFRGWQHQNEVDGKSWAQFYAKKHVAELYKVKRGGREIGRGDAA